MGHFLPQSPIEDDDIYTPNTSHRSLHVCCWELSGQPGVIACNRTLPMSVMGQKRTKHQPE